MKIKRRDTPEARAFWESVEGAVAEWEDIKPAWAKELDRVGKYQVHRIDGNQQAIADYLQAHGFSVESIGRPLDLLVGKDGRTYLIECKLPKGKLRPSQEKFLASWRGHAAVVRDLTDAKALIDKHRGDMHGDGEIACPDCGGI